MTAPAARDDDAAEVVAAHAGALGLAASAPPPTRWLRRLGCVPVRPRVRAAWRGEAVGVEVVVVVADGVVRVGAELGSATRLDGPRRVTVAAASAPATRGLRLLATRGDHVIPSGEAPGRRSWLVRTLRDLERPVTVAAGSEEAVELAASGGVAGVLVDCAAAAVLEVADGVVGVALSQPTGRVVAGREVRAAAAAARLAGGGLDGGVPSRPALPGRRRG